MKDAEIYTTARRIVDEGFSEAFLAEAKRNVQDPLFGDWPLYGSGAGYGRTHETSTTVWCFGSIFGRGAIDLKSRTLVILASLCALQRGPLIRNWTNASCNVGWLPAEIKEMGMWVAHFSGFPTSRGSVLIFDEVFEERKLPAEADAPAQPRSPELAGPADDLEGKKLATALFGSERGDVAGLPLAASDPFVEEYVCWVYGYLLGSRSRLTIRIKVLAAIAMCTVLSQDESLALWISAARNAGSDRAEVREVIITSLIYGGFPCVRKALTILAKAWPESEGQ